MQTIMIQVDKLVDHPSNPRSPEALQANTATLESSLKRGVHKPLTVREVADGTYQILAGHRTHAVAKSLGFAELPCVVVDADDAEALKIVIGDNASVEGITTNGVIASINALLAIGESKKAIEAIVGLSKARLNDLLGLGKQDPSILSALETSELAKDGKLRSSTLIACSRLDGFGGVPAEKVLELVSGKSRKDAKASVERWIKSEAERLARVAKHANGESLVATEPQKRAPRQPSAKAGEAKAKDEAIANNVAGTPVDNTQLAKACLQHATDLDTNGFYRLSPEADVIVARKLASNDVDEAGALLEALETLEDLGVLIRIPKK